MRIWKSKKQREAEVSEAALRRCWEEWQHQQVRIWEIIDTMGPTERRDPLKTACEVNAAVWNMDPARWQEFTQGWPNHWKALSPKVWEATQR